MKNRSNPTKLIHGFGSGLSRRGFLTQSAAAGVSLSAASLLGGTAAAQPKSGGHMRFGMSQGSGSDVLDPGKILHGFLSSMHFAITNTLTEVDQSGNLVPKLATQWDATPDAKTWTFNLRQGVEFHDGKPLTVEDVIASINHHRGEDSSSSAATMVAAISDIRADGPERVVFELSGGDADFPFKMSSFNFPIYAARDDGSLAFEDGIGVGAYRLINFEPGVRAHFEKNPNYWDSDRGHFASAELISIKDTAARTNALRTGEIDGMDRVDLKTASRLGDAPGVVVHEVEGKTHYTFPMLTNTAPFDDNNIRLAVKLGVNRKEMLDTILFGHGSVANDQPINAAYPFFNNDLEQRSYDPDKAKWHLNQAGLDSLDIDLHVADAAFSGAVDAGSLYAEQAQKAGINITVKREPNDGYWSEVWLKKPFCASYWPGYATQDGMFTAAYSAGAAWNDTAWEHARFNDLLVEARSELNNDKRNELYGEMQRLVHEEGGVVIPFFANDVFATSDKVGFDGLSNNYEVDGRMFLERWWFKDT